MTNFSLIVATRGRTAELGELFESLAAKVRQFGEEGSAAVAAVLKMEEGLRASLGPFAAGAGDRREVVAELERDVLFLDRPVKTGDGGFDIFRCSHHRLNKFAADKIDDVDGFLAGRITHGDHQHVAVHKQRHQVKLPCDIRWYRVDHGRVDVEMLKMHKWQAQ